MQNHTLALLVEYRYWIILPLAIFEGPMLAVMLGFLCSMGLFSLIPVFFILSLWDFVRDLILFHAGKIANHKNFLQTFSTKLHVTEEHFSFVSHLWKTHSYKTMLFAKFAFGLSPLLIMTAGVVRMSILRFAQIALEVSILEYALFLAFGYYSKNFEYTGYALVGLVIVFLALYILWAQKARHFFLKSAHKS
jgi:membrane-associated protein